MTSPGGWRRTAAAGLLGALLGGCGSQTADNGELLAALRAGRAEEVTVRGPVTAVLPDVHGREGAHESFTVDVDGSRVEVDHNLSLAGRVPVTPGRTVTVHGQFEPDPGHPVIHYTHHRTGRHEGGWIELDGRRYE